MATLPGRQRGSGWADRSIPRGVRQRAAQLVLDSRRSIRDVAAELGVNHETLRNWVAAERRQRAADPVALGVYERLELARLRRKVAELELEREILKMGRGLLRPGDRPVNRGILCEFIAAEKTTYGVRRLCRVFGISPTRLLLVGSPAAAAHGAELEEAYAIDAACTAGLNTAGSTVPGG